MTSAGDKDELKSLYDELKQFAPDNAAGEMADLAERLRELEPESGRQIPKPDLDEIWDRIESRIEDD